MECNRDEALRALEIAEGKFAIQDYGGAKKLLLKAQQLYPALDKVSHMLAVVEVHSIAQAKVPGSENDWYQLLQVDTTADDSIIKKNYRKLALLLHPDKNKSPGAEAAFKLIGEAWAVLSDKTKRTFYDAKRALVGKDVMATKPPPTKQGENGRSNVYGTQVTNRDANCSKNRDADCSQKSNVGTFWTACPHCKMQYEYYKTYLNFTLKCHKCLNGFVAKDIYDYSVNGHNTTYDWRNLNATMNTKQYDGFAFHPSFHHSFSGGSFPGSEAKIETGNRDLNAAARSAVPNAATGVETMNNLHSSSGGVKIAQQFFQETRKGVSAAKDRGSAVSSTGMETRNGVQSTDSAEKARGVFEGIGRDARRARGRNVKQGLDSTYEKVKEEQGESKEKLKKQQAIDDLIMRRKKKEDEAKARHKLGDSPVRKRLKKAKPRDEDEFESEDDGEEKFEEMNTSVAESWERSADTALDSGVRRSSRKRNEVDYKVDYMDEEDDDDDFVSFPRPRRAGKADVGAKAESQHYGSESRQGDQNLKKQVDEVNDGHVEADSDELDSGDQSGSEDQHNFQVPDPDFYDFDQDRSEKSFSEGQTWAVYDDCGMPRYYCRVMKVMGGNNFGVVIKWLEALPACERTPEGLAGVPVSCGEFKLGKKQQTETSLSVFSHPARVEMVHKTLFKLYPKKGEIWAVFRDWGLKNCTFLKADKTSSWKYDVAEVLTDYSEELGVQVVWLVKVEGYKTVFCRQTEGGSLAEKMLPAKELSRFSHMVPSWKVSGKEGTFAALNGSWDLDPASLPLELIFMPS